MSKQQSLTPRRINESAQKAMARIKSEGLLPSPENFKLWFTYYAKSNAGVTRAIDVLEVDKAAFTDEVCFDIYENFLSEDSEVNQVHEAGDKIQETIKNVSGVVQNARSAATKYNEDLSEVTQTLEKDVDKDQLQAALKGVMASTSNMVTQNQQLEQQLSQSMQIMIEMKQDLDAVRKEALTDSLTQLSNRKAFDETLQECADQVNKEGVEPFSLILLDIDHFKKFNDKFGHLLGDQVLRLVAKTLIDGVKGRDTAARYGGEEFAIILPETILPGGMKVAESLRMAVCSKEITNRSTGEKIARITLSGGVAQYMPGENVEEMIERADNALYAAKRNGRNQIVAAGQQQKD